MIHFRWFFIFLFIFIFCADLAFQNVLVVSYHLTDTSLLSWNGVMNYSGCRSETPSLMLRNFFIFNVYFRKSNIQKPTPKSWYYMSAFTMPAFKGSREQARSPSDRHCISPLSRWCWKFIDSLRPLRRRFVRLWCSSFPQCDLIHFTLVQYIFVFTSPRLLKVSDRIKVWMGLDTPLIFPQGSKVPEVYMSNFLGIGPLSHGDLKYSPLGWADSNRNRNAVTV